MADVYARRRAAVFAELGNGAMVLPAAPPLVRSLDVEIRYRPDSELFYLTGLTDPGALAVLRGGADKSFALFVRPPDPKAGVWEGQRIAPAAAAEQYGADVCHPSTEIESHLPELLRGADRIHYRIPGVCPRALTSSGDMWVRVWRVVVAALSQARKKGQREGSGPRAVVDPGEILDEMRLRKDATEIAALRRAVVATVAGHSEAAGAISPDSSERQVEAVLESAFLEAGTEGSAFAPIVASGPNALTLHYVANNRTMLAGELVLIDAGAEFRMYAGDVSRTYPVSGRFSSVQREAYEVVLAARRAALARIRPGIPISDVHGEAVRVIVEGLVALGALDGDPAELVGDGSYKAFFPHQTSHWLGIDVHDRGDYARGGEPRVLEEGMVLTVEPGLYFRGPAEASETAPLTGTASGSGGPTHPPGTEGSPLPESPPHLAGVGIRIEDDVLVTQDGHEVLSAALPLAADDVERMVSR